MAGKLVLLLVAFVIVSTAAVVTLFTRASAATTGESMSISPSADASVDMSQTKKSFGDDNPVKVEKTKIALIKVDEPSFAGRYITRARLHVYVVNTSKNLIEVKTATHSNWSENTVTYAAMPPLDSTVIAIVPANTPKGWLDIDITDAVRRNSGHAWTIAMTEPAGGTDSLHLTSKESKKNKPQLLIDFASISPIPVSPYMSITPVPSVTSTLTTLTTTPRPGTPTLTPRVSPVLTLTPVPTYPGQATYPSQVFDLTNWKETLPVDANGLSLAQGGKSGAPLEIRQPQLNNYKYEPWFVANPGGGIRFRAPVTGVTTSGSHNLRSELREMAHNGRDNASWSTSDGGIHTMILDQAITHLPDVKNHIVAGQIHDASNDIIVIRLEGTKLFIDINGAQGPILTSNYVLGTRFTVKFEVSGGQTRIYYNNAATPAYTLTKSYSSAYFKTGAYTQSYCSSVGGKETNCSDSNYGEVVVYNATVTHNPEL